MTVCGAGLTLPMGGGSQELYIQALYRWVETENTVEFIPITVGFRW